MKKNIRPFISLLNYTVIDNKIIMQLATGKNVMIPYTKELEEYIKNELENQSIELKRFRRNEERTFSNLKKLMRECCLMFGISTYALIIGEPSAVLLSACFAIDGGYCFFKSQSRKRNIEETKKIEILLENERKLNKVVKENHNVIRNASKKTIEMVFSTPEEKPIFTSISIRKMKYQELKDILENILVLEERYIFDESKISENCVLINKKK